MKIYDKILKLLKENPQLRDNDLRLYMRVLCDKGIARVKGDLVEIGIQAILKETIPFSSVERARRKVQEEYPELRGKSYTSRQSLSIQARETRGISVAYADY